MRSTLFIGSSRERYPIASALQRLLDRDVEVVVWDQGIFGASSITLPSLIKAVQSADFAVLVITGDDMLVKRGAKGPAPRDNVLFELGLFMGGLGMKRTFFLYDRSDPPALPSDLDGVTPLTYEPHQSGNWKAALGAAAGDIRDALHRVGPRPEKRRDIIDLHSALLRSRFEPDLIVGIARSGLRVADALAQVLGEPKRPVISIVPTGDRDFHNDFNSFAVTRATFPGLKRKIKVLVIDDFSNSGVSLRNARSYLQELLGKADFDVRTAAVIQYEISDHLEPNWVVEYSDKPTSVMGAAEPYGAQPRTGVETVE